MPRKNARSTAATAVAAAASMRPRPDAAEKPMAVVGVDWAASRLQ